MKKVSPTIDEADQERTDSERDKADQEMKESVDLFEILEDRYAYEEKGTTHVFNRSIFISISLSFLGLKN